MWLAIVVSLAFELVTDGLGPPTYALDADACERTSATVRSRGRSLRVTVHGRLSGRCNFEYMTRDATYNCTVTGGFFLFTIDGPHRLKCELHWFIDNFEPSPDLVWQGEERNGLREGPWIGWADWRNDRQTIWETYEYRHGKRNGLYVPYRKSALWGEHPSWGYYLDDGKFGHWHEGSAEGEYVRDQRAGLWILRDDRRIVRSTIYKDGRPHGPVLEYYEDGKVRSFGIYKMGSQTGVWRRFNRRGKLMNEERYVGGKRNGLSRTWNEDTGKLISAEEFRDDALVERRPRRARPAR